MRRVFADAQYWVAILNDQDQSHPAARAATQALQGIPLVTTEEVLTEVLAFFCEEGPHLRQLASDTVRGLYANPSLTVMPQSHASFLAGLALYEARPDKGYSLTDCVSMVTMRQEGISEILTQDGHFTQEGFTRLL
jgi:predicted nucleic acid-binding protein